MSVTQLCFAIGLPVFAILMNIMLSALQLSTLTANINARFTSLENRFTSLEARFDTQTIRVVRIVSGLNRLEATLDRH